MIKFENTEVVGWKHAIRGCRNPMNSWALSDSHNCKTYDVDCDYCKKDMNKCNKFYIGEKDLDLMKRLRNAGTDHRKFMRMITVYVDITAPLYWWKEFDTYKVGTVANSCSTMHKIAAKEFTLEDFSCEHLTKRSLMKLQHDICELNFWRDAFNCKTDEDRTSLFASTDWHDTYVPTKKDCWWQMIQLLPSSYNQKRTVMMNYEVLANIYKSRRNHKLDEWSLTSFDDSNKLPNGEFVYGFCDWVKTLPYSELITGPSFNDIPICNEIMEEAKRRVIKYDGLGVVSVPRADAEKFAVDFEEELTKHTERSLLKSLKKGEAL